jgi:hypothetical protein
MSKTKVGILLKYTLSRNELFRYDTYQRKRTKAQRHEGETKSKVTLPAEALQLTYRKT